MTGRKQRIAIQRTALNRNTEKLRKIRDQRVEVDALADWARETRKKNHLTELFLRSIRGRHTQ